MFVQLIKDNQEKIFATTIKKRDYDLPLDIFSLHKIISFVWPRRIGKTFLMIQCIQQLINIGMYKKEQIVFIDFSLYKDQTIDPNDIISAYYRLGSDLPPVFLFDELQDIENFTSLTLQLYTQNYQLFITWSNSKLLSKDLVTEFRGRVYEFFVYPLVFQEILTFNDMTSSQVYSTKKASTIKNILQQHFIYGSFPETSLIQDTLLKTNLLKTYYDIVLYKDLLERYDIENEKALQQLIKKVLLSNTRKTNIIKIYNELKSLNVNVAKNTIYSYYEYLKNVFFVWEVPNYHNQQHKTFLYNHGFSSLFGISDNLWQSFENFIYRELKKKHDKVFYKQNGNEIDFYLPATTTNIQICYHLDDQNFERETKPFAKQTDCDNILVYFEKDTKKSSQYCEIMDIIDFLSSST